MQALLAEADRMSQERLKHHATWRHGNLAFEVLPEADFGQRYVIQAYWMSWIPDHFEPFRRSETYVTQLEPIPGSDIKQVTQQIHRKPPGTGVTGDRICFPGCDRRQCG